MPPRDLLPKRGAPAAPLIMSVVRELGHDDILRLASLPKVRVQPPPIQRIKAVHHRQAALLASGKPPSEVALIVGSTAQRISQLQADPTFRELIAYYQEQIADNTIEAAQRVQGALVEISELTVIEIRDRLANDGVRGALSIDELRKLAEMAADRTVAPPRTAVQGGSVPTNITFNIGGPRQLPQATEKEPKPALVIENEEQEDG